MSEKGSNDSVSRRAALKIIAGSAGAAVRLPVLSGEPRPGPPHLCPATPVPAPQAPRNPKFFNSRELRTLGALSETIIPADEHSPGALAARVQEYMDEIVSDADEKTRTLWRQGVAALDAMAEGQKGKQFADCTAEEQIALLEKVSQNEEHPKSLEERFFVAAKKATVDGYYTSSIGIHQELEYQGNTALAEFEGCTHSVHKSPGSAKEEVSPRDLAARGDGPAV